MLVFLSDASSSQNVTEMDSALHIRTDFNEHCNDQLSPSILRVWIYMPDLVIFRGYVLDKLIS